MRTVSKKRFYARVLAHAYKVQQIGLNVVRYTDLSGRLLGLIIMHENESIYRLK